VPFFGKNAARLPKVRLRLRNTPSTHEGRRTKSRALANVSRGGTARPFLGSRRRSACMGRSSVTTSAVQRALRARSIMASLKARSRMTYSWNHNVPSKPARTSSMEQIDMVLRQNGTPAACAARAAWISPSRWNNPVSPVGASATGKFQRSPSTVVVVERFETSTMTRWRSVTARRSSRLRDQVNSSYEPRSMYS